MSRRRGRPVVVGTPVPKRKGGGGGRVWKEEGNDRGLWHGPRGWNFRGTNSVLSQAILQPEQYFNETEKISSPNKSECLRFYNFCSYFERVPRFQNGMEFPPQGRSMP